VSPCALCTSRFVGYRVGVASQPAPSTHDDLVRALANLGENERREVVAAAERAARQIKPHVVASWRSIRAAIVGACAGRE